MKDIIHVTLAASEGGCYHPKYGTPSCEQVATALTKAVRALTSPQIDHGGYWSEDSRLINRADVIALLTDR